MKLADYLKSHGLTDADFAARVGRDRTTIMRWRRGLTQPDWSALQAIHEATEGEVTPNDFMSGEESSPPFPAAAGAAE